MWTGWISIAVESAYELHINLSSSILMDAGVLESGVEELDPYLVVLVLWRAMAWLTSTPGVMTPRLLDSCHVNQPPACLVWKRRKALTSILADCLNIADRRNRLSSFLKSPLDLCWLPPVADATPSAIEVLVSFRHP